MTLRITLLAFALAALPTGILSRVITITQYPSTCKAVYATPSSSGTVVQSTVPVSPTPLTDASLNAGTPFMVQIQPAAPGSGVNRRQAKSATYLTTRGYTTTNASEAVQYTISNGSLTSTAGGWISTDAGVKNMIFALSSIARSIRTQFYASDLELHWNNSAFDGNTADFFTAPAGNGSQQVIVRFHGPSDPYWVPIIFAAQPIAGPVLEPSEPGGPTSAATIISMGSMTMPYLSTPQPSSNVNPNGICGGNSGYNCFGAPSGSCCSSYGYCGQGSDYCGQGCQAGFGDCDRVLPSSFSQTLVTPVSSASASLSGAASSTTSGVPVSGVDISTSEKVSTLPIPSSIVSSSVHFSLSVPVSGISTVTDSKTFMSTQSSSWTSPPTFTGPEQPIGPVGPLSTSQVASLTSASIPVGPSNTSWTTMPWSSTLDSTSATTVIPVASPSSSILSLQSSVDSVSGVSGSTPAMISSSPAVAPVQTPSSSFTVSPDMALSSTSTIAFNFSSSITDTASSSGTSAPQTAICPASDGTVVTDSNGAQYNISCGADTNGVVLSISQTSNNATDCMVDCDLAAGCLGFTWVGAGSAENGVGQGFCYLKGQNGEQQFQFDTSGGRTPSKVAGIRLNPPGQTSSINPMTSPTPSNAADTTATEASSTSMLISSSSEISLVQSPSLTAPAISSSAIVSSLATLVASSSVPTSTTIEIVITSAQPTAQSARSISSIVASTSTSTSDSPSSSSYYLVIPSPTACSFGDPPGTDEDDSYCEVDLPQSMQIYSLSDTRTFPSTNGYISITSGSAQYEAERFPDPMLPPSTVAPLFDDWYVYGDTSPTQGIFYSLDDAGVWYEYYLARAGQTENIMHFTVRYDYASPGIFTYRYYDLSGEDGLFASVGMQGVNATGGALGFTYSFQTPNITAGLVVSCDSNANTCAAVT